MAKFGKLNDDGSVAEDATECPLTGKVVNVHNSVCEKVPGTRFFYRIFASAYENVTDAQRAQWRKEVSPIPEKRGVSS